MVHIVRPGQLVPKGATIVSAMPSEATFVGLYRRFHEGKPIAILVGPKLGIREAMQLGRLIAIP